MRINAQIKNFFSDNTFAIHIFKNSIDIINYTSLGHFDATKVFVYDKEKEILIKGENLVVSKLLNDEVLITGILKNIEFR